MQFNVNEHGRIINSYRNEAAPILEELVAARNALCQLGDELNGDDRYHDAYRAVTFAAEYCGVRPIEFDELARIVEVKRQIKAGAEEHA